MFSIEGERKRKGDSILSRKREHVTDPATTSLILGIHLLLR